MSGRAWSGRFVLGTIAGFFGFVFLVNAAFVYLALESHPGSVAEDAYRQGLAYNRVLERADRQRALGWRGLIRHRSGAVSLSMTDASGEALRGLSIELHALRPQSEALDRRLKLIETEPGVYLAGGAALDPGRWNLVFELSDRAGRRFRIEDGIEVER